MIIKIKIWLFKVLGLKHGPFMFPVRDYWIFIDTYQRIWTIRYTGQYDIPIQIQLKER